jgi:hypothetical protein
MSPASDCNALTQVARFLLPEVASFVAPIPTQVTVAPGIGAVRLSPDLRWFAAGGQWRNSLRRDSAVGVTKALDPAFFVLSWFRGDRLLVAP